MCFLWNWRMELTLVRLGVWSYQGQSPSILRFPAWDVCHNKNEWTVLKSDVDRSTDPPTLQMISDWIVWIRLKWWWLLKRYSFFLLGCSSSSDPALQEFNIEIPDKDADAIHSGKFIHTLTERANGSSEQKKKNTVDQAVDYILTQPDGMFVSIFYCVSFFRTNSFFLMAAHWVCEGSRRRG